MAVNIIILLVGFLLGYITFSFINHNRKPKFIGTLFLDKTNEEPSMYLELNAPVVDAVENKEEVYMIVHTIGNTSQK